MSGYPDPDSDPSPGPSWLRAGAMAVSGVAPAIGGLFGPVGGAVGGLIGGAAFGWGATDDPEKSGIGGILTHAALGAVGGAVGGRLSRRFLRDAELDAMLNRRRPINTFDELSLTMVPAGVGFVAAELAALLGLRALPDDGLIPSALPTVSIGRGD